MSWQDRTYQYNEEGGSSYPFAQWINDGAQLDPRNPRGGFGMPEDQMETLGTYPAGAEVRQLTFRSGESTTVFFTERMEVVVLATRFCWIKDENRVNSYVPGARSKLQALCLMRDADGRLSGPVMLTFRGIPGKQFAEAYKQHRARVNKATRGAAPSYAFSMVITAGEPVMAGSHQKSRITPVVLVDDFDPDLNYVGDGVLDTFDNREFWAEVKAWREAWSVPGPNGDGEVEDDNIGNSGNSTANNDNSGNGNDTHRTARQDIAELFGDEPAPAPAPASAPADNPLTKARAVKLPTTQKYGANATVADLEKARDLAALQWFVAHPQKYPEVAHACAVVLDELANVPF